MSKKHHHEKQTVDTSGLLKMQKELSSMLDEATRKSKEQTEFAVKLAVVPSEQRSVSINGTQVLVQLFPDNVRIIFPTKELTTNYYQDILKQNAELETQLNKVKVLTEQLGTISKDQSDLWIRNKRLASYANQKWYKKIISFSKWSKSQA